MFEISLGFVLFLLAMVTVPILLVLRAVQAIFRTVVEEASDKKVQEHKWKHANPFERQTMVRRACGLRVIGRLAGAGALVAGVFVASSPALGVACCMAAWRMLKPIKQEMRDACAYKSTGAEDEPRY